MKTASMYAAFVVFFVSLFAQVLPSAGAEWGSLKGRLVVDGQPPALPPLSVTKDQFCIEDAKPHNETVVVGKEGGLANAVVYIFMGLRGKPIEIHPDFGAELKESVELDNKGCAFHPHVVAVRTGQPFVIKNSDPVGHNTNAVNLFNETIASGEERTKSFDKAGALPIPVSCGIHPFMKGYLLIQGHPYMAVSGEDGSFEIKNIPAGQHEFQFWHETGYLRDLKFVGGKTDTRGRAKLKIEPGKMLDLGEIKVPASKLVVK